MGKRGAIRSYRNRYKRFDARWFNRCCCRMKFSFDEVYKILNPK